MIPCILKGEISITDNFPFARDVLFDGSSTARIINMDEDCAEFHIQHPRLLGGECLLPPMDALIAEQDNNERLYDDIYNAHFNDPYINQFVTALIASLYQGNNLLIYINSFNSNTFKKFYYLFDARYGIHMGTMPENGQITKCSYDIRCTPLWINMLYDANLINPLQVLYDYPVDAPFPPAIEERLIIEIGIYGSDYAEKVRYLNDIKIKLKSDKDLKLPIIQYQGRI